MSSGWFLGCALSSPSPPVLSSPTAPSVGPTAATLHVTTNTNGGTLYYVVDQSSTDPTSAQIKAGHDHTGVAADYAHSDASVIAGVMSESASGLIASTAYFVHFIQNASSLDSNIVKASFTTDSAATGDLLLQDGTNFKLQDNSTNLGLG